VVTVTVTVAVKATATRRPIDYHANRLTQKVAEKRPKSWCPNLTSTWVAMWAFHRASCQLAVVTVGELI
jgi:hypothetical protein